MSPALLHICCTGRPFQGFLSPIIYTPITTLPITRPPTHRPPLCLRPGAGGQGQVHEVAGRSAAAPLAQDSEELLQQPQAQHEAGAAAAAGGPPAAQKEASGMGLSRAALGRRAARVLLRGCCCVGAAAWVLLRGDTGALNLIGQLIGLVALLTLVLGRKVLLCAAAGSMPSSLAHSGRQEWCDVQLIVGLLCLLVTSSACFM
jgi:hypothetical protein